MKKRYLYLFMFALPGFFIAAVLTFGVVAAGAGLLWIFVYGDEAWPKSLQWALPVTAGLVFFTAWFSSMLIGYRQGRQQETSPGNIRHHVVLSVVFTVLPILLIGAQQLNIGNFGPPSSSELCADFCSTRGYPASEISPAPEAKPWCNCLGPQGEIRLQRALEDLNFHSPP